MATALEKWLCRAPQLANFSFLPRFQDGCVYECVCVCAWINCGRKGEEGEGGGEFVGISLPH